MNNPIVDRDLTKESPHNPCERIAGFAIASLAGNLGEYHFDGPLDNMLFTFKGITDEQFKAAVRTARNPEKRNYFIENCKKPGLSPEKSSTFDWLEADDAQVSAGQFKFLALPNHLDRRLTNQK